MKAQLKPGYDAKRQPLRDLVPLAAPFTLFISPSQRCNFRCSYCSHSLSAGQKKEAGLVTQDLPSEIFHEIVKQSKAFPIKYKRILLTGLGEPLLNKRIASDVAKLNDAQIAENLEIFTNASLLTPKLNRELIDAGLTRLRISIQGTSAENYRKHCGINIDFAKLCANIADFYAQSRGKCSLYLKIIEEELSGPEDRERFFELFGNITDDIFVENLVRAQPMMGDYGEKIDSVRTFYGEEAERRDVCPYIFYTLQIDAEGYCFPCPPLGLPKSFSLGQMTKEPLTAIWNGPRHRELMLAHLRRNQSQGELCRTCTNYLCFTPKEDDLDEAATTISARLKGEIHG